MPFATKGEEPRWRLIYKLLITLGIGDIVTWAEIHALFDDDTPAASIYGAIQRAIKELEDEHKRTMRSVRGVGYVMAHPRENAALARRQHKLAGRRLRRGVRYTEAADRSMLTLAEQRVISEIDRMINAEEHVRRRTARRITAMLLPDMAPAQRCPRCDDSGNVMRGGVITPCPNEDCTGRG